MNKRQLKEAIYDEIYGRGGYTSGLLAWLYSHLKRYEENRHQAVFRFLERGGRLLDLGCGTGAFAIIAKGMFNDVYEMDISHVRLMDAKKKINNRQDKDHFHFIQYDICEGLPFPDDFFDAVTCITTLEVLVYPSRVILEARRVIKPGGYFIVQVSNFAFLPYRFELLMGKLPTPIVGVIEQGRLHHFTKQAVVKLLRSKQLEVVSLSSSGIFARIRRVWSSLLAGDIIVKARKSISEQKGQNVSPHCR